MICSAADKSPFLSRHRALQGKGDLSADFVQAVSSSRRAVIAATALLALLFSIAAM